MDLDKNRVHQTMHICIRKDIPILSDILSKGQDIAIYYEQSYHEQINNYIHSHYDSIYNKLNSNGILFIYIPMLLENIDDYILFNFPGSNGVKTPSFKAEIFYKIITDNIVKIPPIGRPMLLITDYRNRTGYSLELSLEDMVSFSCFDLDFVDNNQFKYSLQHYLAPFCHDDNILFRCSDDETSSSLVCEEETIYGYDADQESIEILFELRERIERLYAKGVPEQFLKHFFEFPNPSISRLVITNEFRILLPNYNNMEIVLHPLSKALYFFYLRHEGGVKFKYLRDYRDEFFNLYSLLSPCENPDKINQSIDNIIDSTKNTVNENCSRIKSAFASKFQDRLARQYYITGKSGEPKRIILDRKLVEDRSGLIIER